MRRKKGKKELTRGGDTCYIKRALDGEQNREPRKRKKFLTNGSESVKIKKNRESGEETKRVEKASEVVYLVN